MAIDEVHALLRERMRVGKCGDGLVVGAKHAGDLAQNGAGIPAYFAVSEPVDAERHILIVGAIDPGLQPRYEILNALPLNTPRQRLAAAVAPPGEMMHLRARGGARI